MQKINPGIIVWEYTLRCNSKCLHCGSDAGLKITACDEIDISVFDKLKE
ncbi:hypothetical protein HN681_04665 [archaeon]|jgi:MoaA/NifB/PqqE/SkfB family radical SAM enzyme|nr:hypothetical protein [archaeon]MBT3731000.1 hypothetical protein [archaeon]MBT4669762.1 hypothetical protein [archaeon]MBT5029912.1 hypothetical protein [archaeon]MBT5288484.1 hypothetical protein [archaeon]